MDYRAQFGEILKAARLKKAWSQEELAHRAGIHVTYISRLERGLWNPSLAVLIDLAVALDLHPAKLLEPLLISSAQLPSRKRSQDQ